MAITSAYAQNQPKLQPEKYWSTYEDQILGIKIQYPKGWEVEEEPDSIVFVYGEPGYRKAAVIINKVQTVPEYMDTSEKFMKQFMNELRGDIAETHYINNTITMDNKPAYGIKYDLKADPGENTVSKMNYFMVDKDNDMAYAISLSTIEERHSEYRPIFQKMVNSFEILG